MISAISIARSLFSSHDDFVKWIYDRFDNHGISFDIYKQIRLAYDPNVTIATNIRNLTKQFQLQEKHIIRIIDYCNLDERLSAEEGGSSPHLQLTDKELSDKIKTFIIANPGCVQHDIIKATRVRQTRVVSLARKLEADKEITIVRGVNNRFHHYISSVDPNLLELLKK